MTIPEDSQIVSIIADARACLLAADYDRALQLSEQAYNTALPIGDRESMAEANLVRASVLIYRGKLADALRFCMEILDTPDLPSRVYMRADNLTGSIHRLTGDWATAMEYHHRQLDLAEQLNSPGDQAIALHGIAAVYDALDEPSTAIPYMDRVLKLMRDAGDRSSEALARANQSRLYERLGQTENAINAAHEAWSYYTEIGLGTMPSREVQALIALGMGYLQAGRTDEAQRYLQDALSRTIQYKQPFTHGEALLLLGKLAEKTGQQDNAIQLYNEGLRLLEYHENHRLFSDAYLRLTALYRERGDYEQALNAYEKFYEIRSRTFDQESDQRQKSLEVRYHIEAARREAEIYREQAAQIEAQRMREEAAFQRITQVRNDLMDITEHDLKNPLASIRMSVYLLRRAVDTTHRDRWLDSIDNQVTRIQTLLSDTLDFIKLQSRYQITLIEQPLAPILEDVLTAHEVAAREKQMQIDADYHKDLHVLADRERLTRAVGNLVSNAIKFSNPGGTVHIRAERIDANDQTHDILIHVRDTGFGIPADELPSVFDHFYRVQRDEHLAIEGTGLGLSVVKHLVEQHGASVSAESEYGMGSTFTLRLHER